MSPLRYSIFLLFEVPGVLAWAAMYVSIGLLARESWARVTSMVGVGWTVVFGVAGIALWIRAKGGPNRKGAPSKGSNEPC